MKIRKGDTVKITSGKDNGKKGKVFQVFTNDMKLTVEGLNLQVRNTRPKKEGEKGQRVQIAAALNMANVMLICPKCNKPTRVGFKILADKKKMRLCHKCKELF